MNKIATISLSCPLPDIAEQLGRSFGRYGFAIVRDHTIPQDLIERADALSRQFFGLPLQIKHDYHVEGGGARGYTPFGTEIARDARVHDLKEFWHVGRPLPGGHPLSGIMPPNVWPRELPAFRETFEQMFAAFEDTGLRILSAIALHLGLAPDWFEHSVEDGNSVLRLLHYPPLSADAPQNAIRAAAHGDINAITLLLGAEEAGLELLDREGNWVPVCPPPGALAVNVGDMLDRLTNGKLRSTTHRVVNPAGAAARRSRYSMPFFLHFRPDFLIEPLESCIAPGDATPASILAHDFLRQRLREIGLL